MIGRPSLYIMDHQLRPKSVGLMSRHCAKMDESFLPYADFYYSVRLFEDIHVLRNNHAQLIHTELSLYFGYLR